METESVTAVTDNLYSIVFFNIYFGMSQLLGHRN